MHPVSTKIIAVEEWSCNTRRRQRIVLPQQRYGISSSPPSFTTMTARHQGTRCTNRRIGKQLSARSLSRHRHRHRIVVVSVIQLVTIIHVFLFIVINQEQLTIRRYPVVGPGHSLMMVSSFVISATTNLRHGHHHHRHRHYRQQLSNQPQLLKYDRQRRPTSSSSIQPRPVRSQTQFSSSSSVTSLWSSSTNTQPTPETGSSNTTDSSNQPEESQEQSQPQQRSTTTTTTPKISKDEILQQAALEYTRSSCTILGTKSIGVDYGCKRTGVALTVGYSPKPLDIIEVVTTGENNDNDEQEQELEEKEESLKERRDLLDADFLSLSSEISIDYLARQFPLFDDDDNQDDDDDDDLLNTSEEGRQERHLRRLLSLHNHQRQVAQRAVEICRREGDVQRFVVGLPLHKNGTVAEQSIICQLFAMELAKQSLQNFGPSTDVVLPTSSLESSESSSIQPPVSPKVEVWLWDERYSSKEAAARVHSVNPNQGLYGLLDADAACIILEHFYNDHKDIEQQQRQHVNGELVLVKDPALVQKCIDEYMVKQNEEIGARQKLLDDREARMLLRKQRIEDDIKNRQLAQQLAAAEQGSTNHSNSNKKKKKRKRRNKMWI